MQLSHTFLLLGLATLLQAVETTELTISPSPFVIEQTVDAIIWADRDTLEIPLRSKSWDQHVIKSIRPHGTFVEAGETLIEFETTDLRARIEETQRSVQAKSLALGQAEQELAHHAATMEIRLSELKSVAAIAREENLYFNKVRRKAEAAQAEHSVDQARQHLANQAEELKQLKKMYEADDLTEETEEIILTRQQFAVTEAQFQLEMAVIEKKRILNTLLPREATKLSDAERDASIALKQAELSLPRSIQIRKNEIATLSAELQQLSRSLRDLEEDLKALHVTAPANGWFLHGTMKNGAWSVDPAMANPFARGANPAASGPCATFIAESAPRKLFAKVSADKARQLTRGLEGMAFLPGREDLQATATIGSITSIPTVDGQHTVLIDATWHEEPAFGGSSRIQFATYHKKSAIVIPARSLRFGPEGSCVRVKLANGKIESRPVRTGRSDGELTEILGGLEAGQVILVP